MPLILDDVRLDAETQQLLADSEYGPDETVRRALALYGALDEADELIDECELLGSDSP